MDVEGRRAKGRGEMVKRRGTQSETKYMHNAAVQKRGRGMQIKVVKRKKKHKRRANKRIAIDR